MCPAKDAECYSALAEADYFSIHLLAGDQGPLAWQLRNRTWIRLKGFLGQRPNGSPKLHGCLAYLECRHHALYDGGDHGILVGEVTHIEAPDTDREPLVYCKSTLGPLALVTLNSVSMQRARASGPDCDRLASIAADPNHQATPVTYAEIDGLA